ncbi:MAG: GSCFA domain-containing protein [Pseudomonadota bacterium]
MSHPYKSLPDGAFWRRSVAGPAMGDVDPVAGFSLRIGQNTRVATAGSCFAQHIARYLASAGLNYHVAEPGHPVLPEDLRRRHGYGTFSARYGNIYTARQLRQLMERAYGRFVPQEPAWVDADGTVRDPFRPGVQPGGFVSVREMELDRAQHLAAVRRLFETLDVFVFTLGLTECWESRADGAVFPLCPGVEGGSFDPACYGFRNQDVPEVVGDMSAFLDALAGVNPAASVILTVSPVPLMATARADAHVLAATTYSKSVLRVAAEMLAGAHAHVHYFPSYEIVTGPHARGAYYAHDLRNVTEAGVAHVMGLFLAHAVEEGAAQVSTGHPLTPPPAAEEAPSLHEELSRAFVEAECDEVALDRG